MEGFRYHDASASIAPDFFKGFPPMAVFERNLVWDTQMLELFGQSQFGHLRLNEPYHLVSGETLRSEPLLGRDLGGSGNQAD
jgi:hypothetical protein